MRKLLFILLFIPLISSAQTQSKPGIYYDKAAGRIMSDGVLNGTQQVYDDGKQLLKTVDDRLSKAIEKAAPVLKVGAQKVWDTLVKQQRVWALMWTIFLGITIFSWCHFYYRIRQGEKDSWVKDSQTPLAWMTLLISIALSITTALHWETIFTGWFNPDYGAMIQLAEFAKSL
jgi:hypothetical protein